MVHTMFPKSNCKRWVIRNKNLQAEPSAIKFIRKLNKPLVSTSTNVTGHPSPAHFEEISDVIQESVDYILDLPELYQSTEKASSIIKLDKDSTIQLIRPLFRIDLILPDLRYVEIGHISYFCSSNN